MLHSQLADPSCAPLADANSSNIRYSSREYVCLSFLVKPLGQSSAVQASPFLRFLFNIVANKLGCLISSVHGAAYCALYTTRHTIHKPARALLSLPHLLLRCSH